MTDGRDPRASFGQQRSRYPGQLASVCQMVRLHVECSCDWRNASLCRLLASARSTGLWLLWCPYNWSALSRLDWSTCYLGDKGKSSGRTTYPCFLSCFFKPSHLAPTGQALRSNGTLTHFQKCFDLFYVRFWLCKWNKHLVLISTPVDLPGFSVQPVCYWSALHEGRNIQSRLIEPWLWWIKIWMSMNESCHFFFLLLIQLLPWILVRFIHPFCIVNHVLHKPEWKLKRSLFSEEADLSGAFPVWGFLIRSVKLTKTTPPQPVHGISEATVRQRGNAAAWPNMEDWWHLSHEDLFRLEPEPSEPGS